MGSFGGGILVRDGGGRFGLIVGFGGGSWGVGFYTTGLTSDT